LRRADVHGPSISGISRHDRGNNRVHLADAWCGMSGVRPRGRAPRFQPPAVELPDDLASIGERQGLWVALVTGAGEGGSLHPGGHMGPVDPRVSDTDRRRTGRADRKRGASVKPDRPILESIPALLQGRVWDATGRTSIPQLMKLLHACRWVIGADTGPLHLGTLMGSRAIGLYFSHARVHETGPYGEGHWVYQHATQAQPECWPIMESIALICDDQRRAALRLDPLEESHGPMGDEFLRTGSGQEEGVEDARATVWRALSPTLCESVAA
jgi:hypothetical protein